MGLSSTLSPISSGSPSAFQFEACSLSECDKFSRFPLRVNLPASTARAENPKGSSEIVNISSARLTTKAVPQKFVGLKCSSSTTPSAVKGYRRRLGNFMAGRFLSFHLEQNISGLGREISRSTVLCNMSMTGSLFSLEHELFHDLAMGVITVGGALGSLRFWDELAKRDVFDKKVSRKLVHISTGLIFMLFWPLFSHGYVAPYIAGFSVGMNGLRMLAVGFGIMEDDAVVKAMTRDGDPKELVKGPFYYAATILLVTICLWRTSPLAPIIIANLCAGDGFADLIGRRLGTVKLPYNRNKSYVGSLAMLTLGFLVSIGYQYYLSSFGYYEMSLKLVIATLIVSTITTIIESLPISTVLDDNLTVPFTSFFVGSFLLYMW